MTKSLEHGRPFTWSSQSFISLHRSGPLKLFSVYGFSGTQVSLGLSSTHSVASLLMLSNKPLHGGRTDGQTEGRRHGNGKVRSVKGHVVSLIDTALQLYQS